MKFTRKSYRRPRRAIRRRPRAKKPTVSARVKKYVKRAIHANIENKRVVQYSANISIPTALAGSVSPTYTYLLPNVSLGTAQHQRIGSEIKVMKGIIKGRVNLNAYNATSNTMVAPVFLKIWILSMKDNYAGTAASIVSSNINSSFFDYGSTSTGFQGNPLDLMGVVNTQEWTVYQTKIIKLGVGAATNTYPSTGVAVYDNSSWSGEFTFNWGKYCKSKLKYLDTASIPNNRNMYIIFKGDQANGFA